MVVPEQLLLEAVGSFEESLAPSQRHLENTQQQGGRGGGMPANNMMQGGGMQGGMGMQGGNNMNQMGGFR